MPEYFKPIPLASDSINQPEVKPNEQRTPKRIIIKYQTTGSFQDISEEKPGEPRENFAG